MNTNQKICIIDDDEIFIMITERYILNLRPALEVISFEDGKKAIKNYQI